MELRFLGSVEVVDDRGNSTRLGGRARRLLTVLALQRDRVVSRNELIDRLWVGEPPPTATTALRGSIMQVRDALEPDRARGADSGVRQVRDGWRLAVPVAAIDMARFEAVVHEADRLVDRDPAHAIARWRQGLSLWRGVALDGVRDELEVARSTAVWLDDLRLRTLERCLAAEIEQGRPEDAIGELRALVEEHPCHERFIAHLMVALFRSGRQADSLGVYEVARRRLRDELGVRPGRELDAVHVAVLNHEAYAGPAAAATRVGSPPTHPGIRRGRSLGCPH